MTTATLTASTIAKAAAAAGVAATVRLIQSGAAVKQALAANVMSLLQAADYAAIAALLRATDAQTRALSSNAVFLTPSNLAGRACFSAHKNGVSQASITGDGATLTQVTFGTEEFDVGSYFASSAWTPPAGPIRLFAQLYLSAGVTVSTLAAAAIFKNGSILHQGLNYAGATANAVSVPVAVIDVANGTDAYDVRVLGTSASTLTVNGSASNTWFCGEQI